MKKFFKVLLPLLLCIGLSVLCILFGKTEFEQLVTPKFTPPKMVFSIVWSILYSILFYTMLKCINNKIYLTYILILIFHTLWNVCFFAFSFFISGFIILLVIYFLSWVFMYFLQKEKKLYFYINLPYMIWLLIALYLNLGVMLLNI